MDDERDRVYGSVTIDVNRGLHLKFHEFTNR